MDIPPLSPLNRLKEREYKMHMRKCILIAIVVAVSLTGCGSGDVESTVNGEKISKKQVDMLVKSQRFLIGDQKITDAEIRKSVVDGLVNQALLNQEAVKEGLTVPISDLGERHKQTLASWETNNDMKNSLSAQGFTKSNMKDLLETQMLIQALSEKISTVSEEDLINYYNTHANDYTLYTIKQYIALTEPDAISALSEPAKLKSVTFQANQLAYPIQQQIKAGHKFDIPEVVKIDAGTWWVFGIDKIEVQSFEQIKQQLTSAAQAEKQLKSIQTLLQDLKSKATISPEV